MRKIIFFTETLILISLFIYVQQLNIYFSQQSYEFNVSNMQAKLLFYFLLIATILIIVLMNSIIVSTFTNNQREDIHIYKLLGVSRKKTLIEFSKKIILEYIIFSMVAFLIVIPLYKLFIQDDDFKDIPLKFPIIFTLMLIAIIIFIGQVVVSILSVERNKKNIKIRKPISLGVIIFQAVLGIGIILINIMPNTIAQEESILFLLIASSIVMTPIFYSVYYLLYKLSISSYFVYKDWRYNSRIEMRYAKIITFFFVTLISIYSVTLLLQQNAVENVDNFIKYESRITSNEQLDGYASNYVIRFDQENTDGTYDDFYLVTVGENYDDIEGIDTDIPRSNRPEKNGIYISEQYKTYYGYKLGERIVVELNDKQYEFVVDGFIPDLFSSNEMYAYINEDDFKDITVEEYIPKTYYFHDVIENSNEDVIRKEEIEDSVRDAETSGTNIIFGFIMMITLLVVFSLINHHKAIFQIEKKNAKTLRYIGVERPENIQLQKNIMDTIFYSIFIVLQSYIVINLLFTMYTINQKRYIIPGITGKFSIVIIIVFIIISLLIAFVKYINIFNKKNNALGER